MNSIDDLQIQRLVDGECSEGEIQQILSHAPQSPAIWKQIATAYIENQIWQHQFAIGSNLGDVDLPLSATDPQRPDESAAVGPRVARASRFWSFAAALAAGVLVAIASVYLVDRENRSAPDTSLAVDQHRPVDQLVPYDSAASPSPRGSDLNDLEADYQFVFHNDDGNGGIAKSQVPLYSIHSSDQWQRIHQPRRLSEEAVEHMERNGFFVRQETKYLSGSLEDGKRFVVPVRTIDFSPGL